MRDAAVREKLGVPRTVAAQLAGVSRPTLTLYEIDPEAVRSEEKRRALAQLYGMFRNVLTNAPAPIRLAG